MADRHDKPSLQLAPRDGAIEETATTYTAAPWEQHIINHLIDSCDVGSPELINEDHSSPELIDEDHSSSDSDLGYSEDEPAPVARSAKEKRGSKQREKTDDGNVLLQCYNGMAG